MRHPLPPRVLAPRPFAPRLLALCSLVGLLAVPLAAGARSGTRQTGGSRPAAATPARAPAPCAPLAGPAPEQPPAPRATIGLNFPSDVLEPTSAGAPGSGRAGALELCVLVDSTGTVREACVSRPLAPFDSAAVDAVRWWLFEPARSGGRAVPARVPVTFEVRVPREVEPLVPDVLALARDAERRGNLREALDAWTGALARAGTHPAIQNEWVIREHVVRLAARMGRPPEVPAPSEAVARGAHNLMIRNIARAANEGYAQTLDGVLLEAPWYVDAYRWRASARAACGQRDGAVRDVLLYRLACRDSAGRALAERALAALAASDTIAALTMLKY